MKTYKLTYQPDNSAYPLATRILRARDEQDARRIAFEFVGDQWWLNSKHTKCEAIEPIQDLFNVDNN